MKTLQVPYPKLAQPKKGGLIDAVKKDKFVEWLCNDWPLNKPKHIVYTGSIARHDPELYDKLTGKKEDDYWEVEENDAMERPEIFK
jgi:hypothetical protein